MTDRRESVNRFINHLYALQRSLENPAAGGARGRASEARAALAQLRRGLGKPPGVAVEALPHIVPFLAEQTGDWEREAFFLVGSLFAHHPTAYEARENLGDALRHAGSHESAEKRFAALLNCRRERLSRYLWQAVSLARSHDVPVNYRRLLFDLLDWDHPQRYVQLKWARAYWRQDDKPKDAATSETEEANT